jgi:hypothetical protein
MAAERDIVNFMKIEKKVWPEFFEKILSGDKPFEIRLGDFECKKDDTLLLREYDPETKKYTGREIEKTVTYVAKLNDISNRRFWKQDEIDRYGFQVIGFR